MGKFILSSDSCCDIFESEKKEKEIFSIPLTYITEINGEMTENLDIMISDDQTIQFYENVAKGMTAKTSQLTLEQHYDYFKEVLKTEKKDIVHITLSSGLSGTWNQAEMAAVKINEESEFKVYIVDSTAATVGQRLLVEEALKYRDNGKNAKQTAEYLDSIKGNIQHFIIVDDLFHLKRGGRISAAKAIIGSVLNLKPYIVINPKGQLVVIGKNKGLKKSYSKVLESIEEYSTDIDGKTAYIVHTNAFDKADELEKIVKEKYNFNVKKVMMGPVIGAHVGPGGLAFAFIGKSRPNVNP